jgi:hypothetical protein
MSFSATSHSCQIFGTRQRCLGVLVLFLLSCLFLCVGTAYPGEVSLAWDPNTEADLAGYRIHYGKTSGVYDEHIDVRNVTQYTVTGLDVGVYYFAATAYNAGGIESAYSNEILTEILTDIEETACTYAISPASALFGPAGGAGSVQVTAPPGCVWAAGDAPPLAITSGSSGSGSGTVTYSVPPNTNAYSRTFAATIAGWIFTVTQTSSTLTIVAAAGAGGTISPSGAVIVSKGATKRFVITPKTGYRVADVLVDGKSVGAIRTYTFSNITASHMISASFRKISFSQW